MKKKIYFQTNIWWHLISGIPLSIGIVGLYAVFDAILKVYKHGFVILAGYFHEDPSMNVVCGICVVIGVAVGFREFWQMERYCVHLREQDVYIPDDCRRDRSKIQHKAVTKYTEIVDMRLEFSYLDSMDQHLWISKKLFLVLTTEQGEEHKYFVRNLTNKTLIKLINDIKSRMLACENDHPIAETEEIMRAIQGQNKWF